MEKSMTSKKFKELFYILLHLDLHLLLDATFILHITLTLILNYKTSVFKKKK